jgi:uncharacterized protein (DUF1697 family)
VRTAFLRAVNVGGRTVKMDALREALTGIGLANVRTVIASGNVLFDSDEDPVTLEARIERCLADTFGFEVATFTRSADEMAAIAAREPFPEAHWVARSVALLKAPPSAEAAARVLGFASENDALQILGREVHWACRTRTSDSKLSGAALEKALSAPATVRNVTTIAKLAALANG